MRALYFDTFAYVPSVCGEDDTNAGCMPPAAFYRALLDLHLEWDATWRVEGRSAHRHFEPPPPCCRARPDLTVAAPTCSKPTCHVARATAT